MMVIVWLSFLNPADSHILGLSKKMPSTIFHVNSLQVVKRPRQEFFPCQCLSVRNVHLFSRLILGDNFEPLVISVFLCWSGESASSSQLLLMGKKYQRWIVQESRTS